MLWYLVFTVVVFNGQVPEMKSDFIGYSTEVECLRAKEKINNSPKKAFAECFYQKRGQQF